MDRLQELVRRFWFLLNRRRIEAALHREMEAHRAEMARPAHFGNILRLREEAGDVWGWNWLDHFVRDLKLGLRTLRRSPAFALTSILILSLGIGVNLAFFQIVDVMLLQPLQVRDPQTLVYFHYRAPTFSSSEVPYPVAMFVRANTTVLSAVLASRSATVGWGDTGTEQLSAEFVTANWFEELGAFASEGRVLREVVDGAAAAPAVVVLSHGFWQRNMGGRPDIIGSTVRINGRPAVVAGVADAKFRGLRSTSSPQLWMPIEQIDYFQPGNPLKTDWSTQSISMYGRLRGGASLEAAKASLQATLATLSSIRPAAVSPGQWLDPYSGDARFMRPQERRQVWAVTAATATLMAIVLMIACTNLSNLALARAISRLREMSIRTALGAGRWRVMRLLAVESGLLACAGTVGGLFLGFGATSLVASFTAMPAILNLVPDWRTLLAAAAAVFAATLTIGFAPVWKIGRQDLTHAIRDGGERASHGLHAARLRHWLVGCQIAGSSVLLVFAGQMVGSLQRALDIDQGFGFERVAVLEPPRSGFGAAGSASPYWDQVRAIVGTHPETEGITLVTAAPLGQGIQTSRYKIAQHVWFRVTSVDAEFFSTLHIPIVAGRAFRRGDVAKTAVILSRRGAVGMYGTLDVLGQGFPKGQASPKIVGIAGDAQLSNIQATDMAELYWPLQPGQANAMIVRAKTDPSRLVSPLRDAARAADPTVLPQVRLMRDDFARALQAPRVASAIAALVALGALVLASVGIFGIVSYDAGLRTKEIGIRLALGADRGRIVRRLLRHTVWSGVAGSAVGLACAWPAGQAFAGEPLYLRALDVQAYAAAGVTLVIAASIAAVLPAWRTVRLDPLRALRHE